MELNIIRCPKCSRLYIPMYPEQIVCSRTCPGDKADESTQTTNESRRDERRPGVPAPGLDEV